MVVSMLKGEEGCVNRIGAISIFIKKVREKLLVKTRANFFIISTKAQDVGRIDNDVAVANRKDKPTSLLSIPTYRQ